MWPVVAFSVFITAHVRSIHFFVNLQFAVPTISIERHNHKSPLFFSLDCNDGSITPPSNKWLTWPSPHGGLVDWSWSSASQPPPPSLSYFELLLVWQIVEPSWLVARGGEVSIWSTVSQAVTPTPHRLHVFFSFLWLHGRITALMSQVTQAESQDAIVLTSTLHLFVV